MFIEPVFGEKFFGREEVLATLNKRVIALKGGYRQNLAITGPMLSGKSSILKHFLANLNDPDVIPIYVEMPTEDFQIFSKRFMAGILYYYLKAEGMREKETFEDMKCFSRGKIPKTVSFMDEISANLKSKNNNAAYRKILELTSVFERETGKNCIVVLDEFQNLAGFCLKKPFQTFGKFIMVQPKTMYIVSSSQKTLLREILATKLSLLFGNFEIIEINGFDSRTARIFISKRVGDGEYFKNIKEYLIQVSQGSPFYLDILAKRFSELISGMEKNSERVEISLPQEDFETAKECLLETFSQMLYESDSVLSQYFTNNINFFLEKNTRSKFIPILISLAKGNSTIKEVQDDLKRTGNDLSEKLQSLKSMDIVDNNGVFYKVSDKLFEYWLKHVYALKNMAVIDNAEIKYLEFKNSVQEDYRRYCEFNSKDVVDVVADLFNSFDNDKIRMNMNFRKMPRFDNVTRKDISGEAAQIIGETKSRKWICHIKRNGAADEKDIYELCAVKEDELDKQAARRIIVFLGGMDENAYLLAKEQGVWIWGIEELNKILRLFGKFELVI